MLKPSRILQDLKLELMELTTLDSGQYIMRGLNGNPYAASPNIINDLIRRFTNNNRDRYQDKLARLIDKVIEYAELVMSSAIFSAHLPKDASLYLTREFASRCEALETCYSVLHSVHANLEKVKSHYVQLGDAHFALKIDDLREQIHKASAEILLKIQSTQASPQQPAVSIPPYVNKINR